MKHWDYLIVTASNDSQADSYRLQLGLRRDLGLLEYFRQVLVVADPGGKRVGSGGSTIFCLMEVLSRELVNTNERSDPAKWLEVLKGLRILIVHAGGDSQRLPAYGPCGKIFVPVPGESDSCLPTTLFDRQLPAYLGLPAPSTGTGQIVITAGDVLLQFDPAEVSFSSTGLTGLGCLADPQEASKHGVFVRGETSEIKRFLQKPDVAVQQSAGAIDPYGNSVLDIGVMNFDAATAVAMLDIFGVCANPAGKLELSGELGQAIMEHGLDFYREICCAMGSEATMAAHIDSVRGSGSNWSDALLGKIFQLCSTIPFHLHTLSRCDFLHFGTSRQLISSGNSLVAHDRGVLPQKGCLEINNIVSESGSIDGRIYWVEGCRIDSEVTLQGQNLLIGVDVSSPIKLPSGICLDLMPSTTRADNKAWFVRIYGIEDTFKDTAESGTTFCGMPIPEWLKYVKTPAEDVWPDGVAQTVFNAKLFPAIENKDEYRNWLWMCEPQMADDSQITDWRNAERYSFSEIAHLSDNDDFFARRECIRSLTVENSLRKIFRVSSEFSAEDLVQILRKTSDKARWVSSLIAQMHWHCDADGARGIDSLIFPRIIHTLASAIEGICPNTEMPMAEALPGLDPMISLVQHKWLASLGLKFDGQVSVKSWCRHAHDLAFKSLGTIILSSGIEKNPPPRNSLRQDEIVWARSPARFDTGGGWTDTPPYCLEYGGTVVNTAVDLNGQPPIQAYARVIEEPVVRIGSIDLGERIEVTELEDLLDYNKADSTFGLAKAAIALCGFSPVDTQWSAGTKLQNMLMQFGGGIEITTLAAIPKGSGLGTSSIVGAVLISTIKRVMGQTLSQRELFNAVLKLEQALTTGGGWQDQIGGAVGGSKIISTNPGLVPDARVNYLPADVIDPAINNGQTLLYYTGITRLAKNILEKVVGGYLDRKRHSMATLRQIQSVGIEVAEAMSRKDMKTFGHMVDRVWELNIQLDPNSTNPAVEELLARVRPYVYGAKLLGAGGGGFLLMVCKSPEDARGVRQMLESEPPNERARFFDYSVNHDGLTVTVC